MKAATSTAKDHSHCYFCGYIKSLKTKQETRKLIREKLRVTDYTEMQRQSTVVMNQIEQLTAFETAKTILSYWSLPNELNTKPFNMQWAQEKRILLPVIKGDILEIREFDGIESMKPEPVFGILEPTGTVIDYLDCIDLVIVPCLAYTPDGKRLGKGKGFYDKLLGGIKGLKIGVCFDFQLLEDLPVEAHDLKVDQVISA